MIAELIITFREALEATLLVSIFYGYIKKTNKGPLKKYINLGILIGVFASVLAGILIKVLLDTYEGRTEEIFEGSAMVIGSVLISTVIIWLSRQHLTSDSLDESLAQKEEKSQGFTILFLVFISIFREGIETVLFLAALQISSSSFQWVGAILGLIIAVTLGILIYQGLIHMNLKIFFNVTSILLIFVAAGLFAHGIHEFQEAGVIPIMNEHVYDINGFINENGTFGSIIKGLFGYNGNPSLTEMLTYGGALGINFWLWKRKIGNKRKANG